MTLGPTASQWPSSPKSPISPYIISEHISKMVVVLSNRQKRLIAASEEYKNLEAARENAEKKSLMPQLTAWRVT